MPDKIAKIIVKKRWWILIIALILTAASLTTIGRAKINYDITAYLDDNSLTRRSLDIMQEEFGSVEQVTLMATDIEEADMRAIAEELNELPDVMRASFDPETDIKTVDGVVYSRITLFTDAEDSVEFVKELEQLIASETRGRNWKIGGGAMQMLRIQRNIANEIPVAMAIAVAVVILVLLISSHSYFEPVVFLIVLVMSIIMNMGTNWVFSSVSFITFAVAPLLQLALAMDYSIMLLHGFFRFRAEGLEDEEALEHALSNAFMPIVSSSLTTVAGLTALMFMSFSIGFDIGIVLAKGIVISMLSVFTIMPAFVMIFARPLARTLHKPLPLGGNHTGKLAVASRRVLPILLVLIIALAGYLQTQNEYAYTEPDNALSHDAIGDIFGRSNQMVLLLPCEESDEDYETQLKLIDELNAIRYEDHPAVTSVTAMVTTAADAIAQYSAADIAEKLDISPLTVSFFFGSMGFGTTVRGDRLIEKAAETMPDNEQIQSLKATLDFARSMFLSPGYSRIILLLDMPVNGSETVRVVEELRAAVEHYYPDAEVGIAGNAMSSYEIGEAFQGDMLRVSVITIVAVFLIIMLSFRSLCIPALLVCVIQGAIWLNMSISFLTHEAVFFMCYLVCLTIQMGATIDYGILTTENYRKSRLSLAPREAIVHAMTMSMPTIFTSGLILVVASFIIGRVCSVYYIYSIGLMLARGAAVSILLVLLLLPPMLLNLDGRIVKKKP